MQSSPLLEILADGRFHSGAELGERLGVSRAAVWKQIKKLAELGLQLHSVKGRGYRLPEGVDLLDEAQLRAALASGVSERIVSVYRYLTLPSTNGAAMELIHRGEGQGCLFLAEQQTAGKGRRGRTWVSPFARNLYFSLIWSFGGGAAALEGLSLVVGAAIREGLADIGAEGVDLKWPNDLLAGSGKLAGILLEMTGDAQGQCQVVIGVGVNVSMSGDAAAAIDQPWTDLRRLGVVASRNHLLAAVLNRLVPALECFSEAGFAPFRQAWQAHNRHQDRRVVLNAGNRDIVGICRGVDDQGALLLETDDGLRAFHGGELSLRALS